MSSGEISSVLIQKFLEKFQKAQISAISIADGGEGSLDALFATNTYRKVEHTSQNALSEPIETKFLMSKNNSHAVIELAQTCGLDLFHPERRDCLETTTYGIGLQIHRAIDDGARSIDLLIGGSATNDLGLGMASALGHSFYRSGSKIHRPRGKDMLSIDKIDMTEAVGTDIDYRVVCDVENVLLGEQGAARMFGKQKGASQEGIDLLEAGAENIISITQSMVDNKFHLTEGAGAAGGVGWGAMFFLNATFISGINYMIDNLQIEDAIQRADLIITGEGKIDEQTQKGKLVKGIAKLAKRYNKKTIAICAINELMEDDTKAMGLHQVYAMYDVSPNKISKADTLLRMNKICESIMNEHMM